MPSKINASKRKSDAPPSRENLSKAARTHISRNAATSIRQVSDNEHMTNKGGEKENVGEPTGRAVRTNRGRGGHAYQLENALKPMMRDQARTKTNEGIPEDIPENAMAPQVLHKALSGKTRKQVSFKTKTTQKLPRPEATSTLPRAGPKPVYQTALKDSRFGFSTGGDNPNSSQNPSQDQRTQADAAADQPNLTHRRPVPSIKDDDNDNGGSDNGDEDGNNSNDESNNLNSNDSDGNDDDGSNGSNNSDVYSNIDRKIRVDEASPSKKEAAAQAYLRALHIEGLKRVGLHTAIDVLEDHRTHIHAMHPPNLDIPANTAAHEQNLENDGNANESIIDVLEDHRTRNHAMHPPNLDIPANTATHDHQLEDDGNESVIEEAEDDESSTQRARRFSKTPRDAEPKSTTMKYYPPCWQAMLEIAKNNMRKHVALVNAFPQRDRDLKEATLILRNTIAEYQRIEGNTLNPGYSPDRDMSILVFNEHSNFRQKLKKCVQRIMLAKYGDLLSPPDFEGGNQEEVYDFAREAVHKSLKDGLFLRGGEDENGRCKNLAHPAIPAVIHEFFYTDKDCLAALYREDFEHTVPDHAIALVMTCIQNCLEEYVDLGYRKAIPLDGDTYRVVMKHHLRLVDTLKSHEYHGARYEARRTRWARKGMQFLERDETPAARYAPTLQLD